MTKRILCAFDGSNHARMALRMAAEMAARFAAPLEIVVVHVLYATSPRGLPMSLWTRDEAAALGAEAEALAAASGHPAERTEVIEAREAAACILTHAGRIGADHIVIGTGDKRGLERLVMGSVAQEVASRAPCTVTIAR
jgi:nucleotide-binding universal stress UspA family protein